MIEPFSVQVPDDVLDDLRARLARTRWPDQIPGTGWEYGTELAYLQELCEYWRDGDDWRQAEKQFNSWEQGVTSFVGLCFLFLLARSLVLVAVLLLVLLGW